MVRAQEDTELAFVRDDGMGENKTTADVSWYLDLSITQPRCKPLPLPVAREALGHAVAAPNGMSHDLLGRVRRSARSGVGDALSSS